MGQDTGPEEAHPPSLEELERSHVFLHSIVDNIPDMIFVKDAKELRFVLFNKAGEELLGYPRSDLIGKTDYDFFPKSEADFFTGNDRKVLESGALHDIPEEPIHTRHKGVRILHTKKIPILDANGTPLYLLGISEDITARKEAEDARQRLEREILEISDREKQRIGQDMHDGLGQDLTGIALMAKVLEKRLKGRAQPEADEVHKILTQVNKAITKTRHLARGLHPVTLKEHGLVSAIDELAANTQRVFGIKCSLECGASNLKEDITRSTHLYRIVQEAIHNAIRHGEAKQILIRMDLRGDRLVLAVQDDGNGLPDRPSKGGMGLPIMNYRANMIGGSLDVVNAPDGGVVVTCSLPLSGEASR